MYKVPCIHIIFRIGIKCIRCVVSIHNTCALADSISRIYLSPTIITDGNSNFWDPFTKIYYVDIGVIYHRYIICCTIRAVGLQHVIFLALDLIYISHVFRQTHLN